MPTWLSAECPLPRLDHTEAVVEMALAMLEVCARLSRGTEMPFTMRIGINTGPVVAGVIGIKKFIYDLWGDTVNLASRMESHGVTGEIQVTDAVYQRMRQKYLFESARECRDQRPRPAENLSPQGPNRCPASRARIVRNQIVRVKSGVSGAP